MTPLPMIRRHHASTRGRGFSAYSLFTGVAQQYHEPASTRGHCLQQNSPPAYSQLLCPPATGCFSQLACSLAMKLLRVVQHEPQAPCAPHAFTPSQQMLSTLLPAWQAESTSSQLWRALTPYNCSGEGSKSPKHHAAIEPSHLAAAQRASGGLTACRGHELTAGPPTRRETAPDTAT